MGKKLIEVALPLPEINDASAYDKMPGIGPHPKGIHHWWARLPLPVSRAVLFASVVDDPSAHPEKFPSEETQNAERERLFAIIRRMMQKQLHKHPEVYAEARTEMLMHCGGSGLPAVFDPFAGGGSIPLEAARLGFEAHAGDSNPVCVLLNKCNLELAPRWDGYPPVNPKDRNKIGGTDGWCGTTGLAADVRHYGRVILERAREKIGHLYPSANVTEQIAKGRPDLGLYAGKELRVIAWIWARTLRSPNPAAHGAHVPLMSTYWLSSKAGSEAWLDPVVDRAAGTWRFAVQFGPPSDRAAVKTGTKAGRARFRCLLTGDPITDAHIKAEGRAGRLRVRLVAVVAEGQRGRIYLPAIRELEETAQQPESEFMLEEELTDDPRNIWCVGYGLRRFSQVFTSRQLAAMGTLTTLVRGVREDVRRDAAAVGLSDQEAATYASTVITFLALALDRCADFNNALCGWNPSNQKVMHLFGRQAIPMVWDFAEANMLGEGVGAWETCSEYVADCIEAMTSGSGHHGYAHQIDAANSLDGVAPVLVSTDPPYYDNISYAALSDFFYVWLRRTIGDLYPDLFQTILVPKVPELVAAPDRFNGDRDKAKEHFERGFRKAFAALGEKMDPRFPLTVYYAFKQDDEESGGDEPEAGNGRTIDRTTGWETMLEALIGTGFQITATWPVRASQKWRMVSMGTNALASYIVLACRPRSEDALQTDRRSFVAELKRELPSALRHLQQGNIAPVDFAQAAIGPGMAIYSRHSSILAATGRPMSVRTALALINQALDEVLAEQDGEFDPETRWAIAWFEQFGMNEGAFGVAETLSKAKNTAVNALVEAGIVAARQGRVRLLRREELPADWDPTRDRRVTIWEVTQHLIRLLEGAGELAAARLLSQVGGLGEAARDLAYRLYVIADRKKWAQEALGYNSLVVAWAEISRLAGGSDGPEQSGLDL